MPIKPLIHIRIREDTEIWSPAIWHKEERTGFELRDATANVVVWLDYEAIPRLCHLLMELYSQRPSREVSVYRLSENA